jgi:putative aminopeptidase FrvX
MSELLRNIESLCLLCGTPGFEEAVAADFSQRLTSAGLEVRTDNLGNVIGHIPGGGSRASVMLAAHLDEVGLVVQYMEESGFLRFDSNGMVDPRVLPGTAVLVDTAKGPRHGTVGMKPSHLVTEEDRKQPLRMADLWIDVGADNRTQAAEWGIQIGDPIAYRPNFVAAANGYLFSKSLDNRIGLGILLNVMRRSQKQRFPFDLYLVGTVQEEIGGRGAKVAAQAIKPTIAIIVDTVSATDAVARPPQATAEIGKGPVLRSLDFRDNNQGTVYSRKMRRFLMSVAEQRHLPYQLDIFRTWTDASTIHVTNEGVAMQGLFVPRRYSHAPIELAHMEDIRVTADLMWEFLCALSSENLADLAKRF